MSTKTTYKRIALVAVAALGFGLLSVVPSSAVSQSDTLALGATASTTTVGTAASTSLTQTFLGVAGDTMTVTVSLVSGPTGNTTVPTLVENKGTSAGGLPTVSGLVGTMMDTAGGGSAFALATAIYTLGLPSTAIAGTYVIKATPANLTASPILATNAAAVTWTVTVNAVTVTSADTTSTSILNVANVTSGSTTDTAVTVAASTAAGSTVATITVTPRASSVATTGSTVLTATLTGPGTLSAATAVGAIASSGLKSVTFGAAPGAVYVHVYGDGTAGLSTITISIGGVTVGTETVTLAGAASSAVATVVTPVITSGSGAAAFNAVTAIAKDANGNVVAGKLLYAVSGTTTVFASTSATTDATGKATFALTGLAAGTSTVTVQDVAAGSTVGFAAAAVSVRAGTTTAATVTMSLNKASYTPGEAAVLTVIVKDAAGNTLADSTPTVFATGGVTSSRALTAGTLPTATTVTTGSSTGTLTYAINVPSTQGDFTISATGATGITGTLSVTATVTPSAAEQAAAEAIAAAADAAAEATDAANAATDAANAAAEAADAATAAAQDAADAIAALSVQVGELVAGLTAQITAQKAAIRALTNLVIKIQKAVNKK